MWLHIEAGERIAVNEIAIDHRAEFTRQSGNGDLLCAAGFRPLMETPGLGRVRLQSKPSPGELDKELAQHGIAAFHAQ